MPPRKEPKSLYTFCVKSCINLINSACYVIEKRNHESNFCECEEEALLLKCFLTNMLPARLFDVLCSERASCSNKADPRIQLLVLTHPNMTIFRKCDLDNGIPHQFWIENLAKFSKLVVLDLKFICTDEILHIVCANCPHLEEINIVSKVDICKSPFNACVLVRNVSDHGLCSVSKLKKLRILAMDQPKNQQARRNGRCVSQTGIIMLLKALTHLEELRIESCDIGSTLIRLNTDIGPLGLKKINCQFASADGVRKLIKICPFLKEFSFTYLTLHDREAILNEISFSELKLQKLELLYFSFTKSMHQLLMIKGNYITQFSLCEMTYSLTFDAISEIGKYCPNLITLCVVTQSKLLILPPHFKQGNSIFTNLQSVTVGCGKFDIDQMVTFFFTCAPNLRKFVLKYEAKKNINSIISILLSKGQLNNLTDLWLDCTLSLSKNLIMQIIESCAYLQRFAVAFIEDLSDIQTYIRERNLDLKLEASY